jgi:hypothetical protein
MGTMNSPKEDSPKISSRGFVAEMSIAMLVLFCSIALADLIVSAAWSDNGLDFFKTSTYWFRHISLTVIGGLIYAAFLRFRKIGRHQGRHS